MKIKIKKANKKEMQESLNILLDLKEWFTKEAIKKARSQFKKNLIVAKDKEVLGFINYKINKKSISILWMGIKRNYQRRGIGRKLLEFLEKIAREKKKNKIRVETLTYKDNYEPYKKTRQFYLKQGYIYKFIRKAKKKGYDDLVIMEKHLK